MHVALPRILHDEDVELPRQEDDRHHRDQEHRGPARIGGGGRRVEREEPGPRARGDRREDVTEAPEEPPRHPAADEQERHELDDGLHGNSGHEARLLSCEVEVPGAEQDAEERERAGDEQRRVEAGE